ncbi:DCC1-like thiol-disulfide oxidoreductase family protein [Streptomyces sp. NPDC051940]|uniref:thiol-disulfide oxidoreductase DCC family protein n=1 Tax=Streptomyces sp. NPDC051940 TaxID=3155675 RepID=UPI0034427D3D
MRLTQDAATRGPAPAPVRRLTVLYDAGCSLCVHLRGWLVRQRQLVPLDLVPCGSDEARRRFPELDHAATREEITVVGDSGQVYRGQRAWIVVLWALAGHRGTAHRLSSGAGAGVARAAVLAAARYRKARAGRTSAWGGGSYQAPDGWRYDPAGGWSRTCTEGGCPAPPG